MLHSIKELILMEAVVSVHSFRELALAETGLSLEEYIQANPYDSTDYVEFGRVGSEEI